MISRVSSFFNNSYSLYDFTVEDCYGNIFDFSKLEDKVILIVNITIIDAFLEKIFELQTLYDKYNKDGLEIIAFPTDQFLSPSLTNPQTLPSNSVSNFCQKYNITFPVMEKCKVNGKNQVGVYRYLKAQKKGPLGLKLIKWNFEKFLIDKDGEVSGRFSSLYRLNKLEKNIKSLLFDKKKPRSVSSRTLNKYSNYYY
ncbi:glutathione peroxidase [Ascoidea rubescens DSM 1968]|uniref:Glutathione peroxidase n=1 Tax=Ascoidea rubescens DSM 1968 TaxID=1344418 RepID=A0A1D2VLA4_9ASCO|nr:thioredoxin-like protein [Ascoidea rubescens DSM 1968]ODV62389.1 thioredoxin-like protein [Ascoidea rubescens DSM 1968]